MATIRNAIQITDGMSPALRSMNKALNLVISSFEDLQAQSGQAVNTASIASAREELNKTAMEFDRIEREAQQAGEQQKQFNEEIQRGDKLAGGLGSKIKALVSAYAGIQAIRKSVGAVKDWMGFADIQNASEKQLSVVMANMGATREEFESIKKTASGIQGKTTMGDEALLAGAGELATYLKEGSAIEAMMGTLANYAVGMGGADVNKSQMVEYATQLGKALDGTYDGLRKKGFEVTDAQKAIIENGTEMERVAVIQDVIAQSWDNLAESMRDTPEGKILSLGNAWTDVKETLGNRVYPAVLRVIDTLTDGMGSAETMMMAFAGGMAFAVDMLGHMVNGALWFSDVIANNWGWIEPAIVGITSALVAYKLAMLAQATATWVAKVAQDGLNLTMLANPALWIALAIGALIAVLYKWVQANGGVKVSLMILQDYALLAFDGMKIGAVWMVNKILDGWDALTVGTRSLSTGIQNIMGDMKAGTLNIIDGMVNGAIDMINKMISTLNKVPGVSLSAIESVSFGAEASIQNEAEKQARNGALEAFKAEKDANKKIRDEGLAQMIADAQSASDERRVKITSAREEALAKQAERESYKVTTAFDSMAGSMTSIDDNTAGIRDAVTMAEEDLRYMRDLAEQEVINRFTTAEVKIDMKNDMNINSNMDLDGVVAYLEDKLTETLNIVAEGVPIGV